MYRRFLLLVIVLASALSAHAQCDPNVPTFAIDLSGSPDSTWTSPSIARDGHCCGTGNPDRCIEFYVTLDPNASGIFFDIIAGAVPGGSLFYQVNCGPPAALGSPICLSGPGPHMITFCKPGNNPNVYQITSIPGPVAGTDITINDGCNGSISAAGFDSTTVTWTSIFPGAQGAYDNYLSCTSNCLSPNVSAVGTPPPFVDYIVCGLPASQCDSIVVCDTVRANFNPSLGVSIVPQNPTICFGQTSTTITAVPSGGTPPYTYLWNNINPNQTQVVGAGTFTVELSDSSGCPPVYATVTVTAFANPITADAGPDDTICIQNPLVPLNGAVTGASGGQWVGGSGTFSPHDSLLTGGFYTPTAAELANGFVTLILNTTGNGTCPPDADTVTITFLDFIGAPLLVPADVSCFGFADGLIAASVTGGLPDFTYQWNTVPPQTNDTATGLGPGTYDVIITNSLGCTTTASATINQPPPLAVNLNTTHVSCAGGSDGSITAAPVGGTPPYTYSWSPGNQTTAGLTNQPAGVYTVTVTDDNGCVFIVSNTITEPLPLAVSFTQTNVSCFGGNDGSANAIVTGGSPSYTYNWTPYGGTAANAIGFSVGTFVLTITDSLGCTLADSVTITEPPVLTATAIATEESCDYADDGTATVTASGGTPGYSYSWSPGNGTSPSLAALTAGIYTVIVTDTNGCSSTTFATVNEPPPLALTMSQTNVSCFAGSDGVASVGVSGGTAGYTYSWAPGNQTTSTITGLSIGTYTVTVTDANGCFTSGAVTITQPLAPLAISGTVTDVSCFMGTDGAVTTTTTGGTTPYSYAWTPGGQTTANIANLDSGFYVLTVTDSFGCMLTQSFTVIEPAPLSIAFAQTNISCFGGSDGSVTATVSGGTTNYSYSWNNSGSTTATATGLSAGVQVLTVIDNLGCVFADSVILTDPPLLVATATASDETCDYLDNGTVTAGQFGGTAGYTYLWMPGSIPTQTATGLAAGTYTVTVSDALGCTATQTATVNQPAPLAITFANQINVSCNGGNNGAVSATVTGGTPNYSYLWTPGNATTNSINGLSAGTYTLTVTDNNGCTEVAQVTITQPPVLAVTLTPTPASCFGFADGAVTANPSGGTAPYTYNWMPGSLSGQTVTGLLAGTYNITVTDSLGCTATNAVVVTEPGAIMLSTASINSNCGLANGVASVTVTSGGTGPFTYLWSPSLSTNDTATGLLPGSHSVTVTDFNGCTSTISVNVNDNAAPSLNIFSITHVTCFGGSDGTASVLATGGVPPYTYLWSNGNTTATATGLSAGNYTVVVTGANGCVSSITTSPGISQPPAITAAITTTNVSCNGGANGAASIVASGGTPGYTYQWWPGGTTGTSVSGLSAGLDSVTITDANGCTLTETFNITQPLVALSASASFTDVSCSGGSDGTASASAAGGTFPYSFNWTPGNVSGQMIGSLPVGTYTVTVTDNLGCTATDQVTIAQPTPLVLVMDTNNSTCAAMNGQASVAVSGGTTGYQYQWSPSGGTNAVASGLLAGVYTVEVTDGNGCIDTASILVLDTPGPVASVNSTTNMSCPGVNDGTATVTVTGGVGPFTYVWSPNGGTNSTGTGLGPGVYTVLVSDANGCQTTAVSPLITQPNPLVLTVTPSDVSCFGGNDGSATVGAVGGTPNYTYTWLSSGTNGPLLIGQSAGVDSVQVSDANGCIETITYNINQPSPLVATITDSTMVSCLGGADGSATVAVSGGTQFYSYNWVPYGGSGPSAIGLAAGIFTVNITDQQGCTTSASVTITEPAQALTTTATATPTSCFGAANGTANALPLGGTPGYSYLWTPSNQTTQAVGGLIAGVHTVLVTDTNGCQANAAVIIVQPTAMVGSSTVTPPTCGLPNGSITTAISGGTGPYTYLWTPGNATTPNLNNIGPGIYTVTVTDDLGCVLTLTDTLVNIPGPTITIPTVVDVSCFGGNDGSATASITSGIGPFTYSWSPYGGSAITAANLDTGTYTITVEDGYGCATTASVTINQPADLGIAVTSLTTVSCNGGSDGSITVAGNGGVAPYLYSWSPIPGNGATISNLPAGLYTVTATDANGCMDSIAVIMTEPASLVASIGTVIQPTCFNSTDGSATVVPIGGTAPFTYAWSNGQNGSTANNLADGTYTVTITDDNGCADSTTVNIVEPAQISTLVSPNDTICPGQNGQLIATASGGSGTYSYNWQPNGVITGGILNDSPLTSTEYIVIAFDQNGCAGSADTTNIIVNTLDPANIAAQAFSPICPGQTTVVWVASMGLTDSVTYTWNQGLGNGPGAFTVIPGGPTTYIVTATNSCGATVVDSVEVTFNPPPDVLSIASADSACAPASIQFTANATTPNPLDQINSWLWDFGDGQGSTLENPVHIYQQAGTYNVTLTVFTPGGCTNDNTGSPITVTVFPYPTALFTVNLTVLDLPMDDLITDNQSSDADWYEWDFGDGSTSTDVSPVYLYDEIGSYQVQLVAGNDFGCTDTMVIDILTNADVIFPNAFTPVAGGPTGGYYDINNLSNDIFFPYASGVEEYQLQIFNRWGELIFETQDVYQGWDGYYRGKLSQQGVYIWKAYAVLNNGRVFNKIGDVTLLR